MHLVDLLTMEKKLTYLRTTKDCWMSHQRVKLIRHSRSVGIRIVCLFV